MVKIFIGVIVAAFVVIIGFMIIDPDLQTTVAGSATEIVNENVAKYSIEGEVFKPGTYTLKDAITMADLIDAAGGITSTADIRSYYETSELTSGTTYFIGSLYDASDVCNNKEIEKVNINEDPASELTNISGITTSIANSIISWRTENGQFTTVEDLLDVYGIGTATYRKIRNYVILHE